MASGTDLESGNPLVTVHPLSRQLQRHALFVTLVRLDAQLQPVPYFARRWRWSPDRTTLTLTLSRALRWHDGTPTSAHDVAFTLDAARDPALGSPRAAELASLAAVRATDDSTVLLRFHAPQVALPLVLAELPLVPRHAACPQPLSWTGEDSAALAPTDAVPESPQHPFAALQLLKRRS